MNFHKNNSRCSSSNQCCNSKFYSLPNMKSESSFICLQRCLIALFILEIAFGVAIVIACEYVKQLVETRVFQIDKHEVLSVFFIVKLFGLHVSFYFLSGIPLIMLFNDVYTRHMAMLLKLWMMLAVETAIGSLFMIWCFTDASRHLIESLETSLADGIKLYPNDPLWVLIWDDLQYDYKCCGVYDHLDWMRIHPKMSGKADNSEKTKNFSWLPYSCAMGNIPVKEVLGDENIHSIGCFNKIKIMFEYFDIAIVSFNIAIIVFLVSQHSVVKIVHFIISKTFLSSS